MPLIVDHDQRRLEIAALVARMIATQGLDAVTVRSVAEEAGYSTAVVSHYFNGKRELLLHCYQLTAARAARMPAEIGEDLLAVFLDALLPCHAQARENWRVWVVFWGVAIADPEFSAVQREQLRAARQRVGGLLAQECPTASPAALDDEATRLLTTLMGIAVQAAFDEPAHWPPERQRRHLRNAISACRAALR